MKWRRTNSALPALVALVGLVALVLLVEGCGRSSTRLPRLDPDATIVAFGDSLTWGIGAEEAESYPAVLEQLVSRKVVRAGVPGETTTEALKRLSGVLDEFRPQLVILCSGGNDLLRRMDEAVLASNLRAMIALARDRGIAVLLVAVPRPAVMTSIPDFYRDIAKESKLPLESEVMKEVLFDQSMKSDPIHPNAKGYRRIAEAIAKVMKSAGAI